MKRGRLLSATAWFCLTGGTAAAQVSVPLPRTQPVPQSAPPTSAPPQSTSVPLPGGTKPNIDTLPVVGQTGTASLPIGKYGRPDINPYDRDMDLTVPLLFKQRALGDMPIRLTYDDRLLAERKPFEGLIGPLLNQQARDQLLKAAAGKDHLESDDLKPLGISFEYDPSSLAVVVLTIDPSKRALEQLFSPPNPGDENIDLAPADFAAFLNINGYYARSWEGNFNSPPSISLGGAMRYGGVVLEADGQFGNQGFGGGAYRFDRNYARFVYDEPADYRRWYLGDLTPEVRGQQGYVQIGGVGVSRQRQRFDPYRSSVLQGNRQLVLQRDASVRIMRNGVLYRELRLDAGSYDFSSLPLLAGSNDVQIEVRDNSGSVQSIAYSQYLDPIDLVPGDFEYAAYIGPTSNNFGRSPSYNGPVAFSGFFRKAFVDAPAIGVGLQASAQVQTLTGQTQFVLGGGSRLLLDGGLSHSREVGEGFSGGVGFDQLIDRGGLVDSASIRADYLSRHYAFLSSPEADNSSSVSISGQYTRQINQRLSALITGSYLKSRNRNDSYRIGVSANYYFDRRVSVRAGVEYSRFDSTIGRGRGLGFNIALVFQPTFRDRFEARHESSTDTSSLSYLHSSSNQIGSLGYGAVATRDDRTVALQGFADYIANRFDATVSHSSYGPNIGGFGQVNVSSVRVGTSIAFADGVVGVGRRVNDSFALLYPHKNLKGHSVVAGQSLVSSDYMSKSGTFGAAVNGYLNSYVNQPIQYDVENPPIGYDIGPGTVRVNPPYHSGYKLKIGTDAFVSAAGVLTFPDGKPVALAGGRVIAKDGKDKEPLPFFTNSVGRFAIQNLRPAVDYRVELGAGPTVFEFKVPADTTGLVDLKTIVLKPAN
ncbi:fimbria/pilus outer membrane usher protein [Sphingomonas psychrotolerans]|uniref:fimbria/pilus outer membrane usher protein n=1 Tax=Sphingomonas psychrotolerans TaxID=1327635 RepID=UPI001F226493|nr:fimbria/pilus outer membrane usher protein [Sphingomonas psychrotolerans]